MAKLRDHKKTRRRITEGEIRIRMLRLGLAELRSKGLPTYTGQVQLNALIERQKEARGGGKHFSASEKAAPHKANPLGPLSWPSVAPRAQRK